LRSGFDFIELQAAIEQLDGDRSGSRAKGSGRRSMVLLHDHSVQRSWDFLERSIAYGIRLHELNALRIPSSALLDMETRPIAQ